MVDCLVNEGYGDVTVVDVSEAALEVARGRLGEHGSGVTWLTADVRDLRLKHQVDVWHDRAVFHFLTEAGDRAAYLVSVRRGLRVGGHVVIATFAPDGPEQCSGLQVERYDGAKLAEFFGSGFELERSLRRQHVTPGGTTQEFTYAVFKRLR